MKGRKTTLRMLATVATAALLLATALAAAGCSCSPNQTASTKVSVPDVVFMESADARQVLVHAGLSAGETTFALSDTVAVGDVISQEPAAQAEVDKGAPVSLTISCGKLNASIVSVPDLTGATQEDAEKMLTAIGLVPVPGNPVNSDTVEPGKVCQQSANPGSQAREGDQITFNVSLGKAMTEVPDVTGKTFDEAKAALATAKLGVDKATAYDDKVPADSVVSQSIPAKTTVAEGTTVTLTVSLGVKPVEKVKVPDIMTYTLDDAEQALKSAGLAYTYSGDPDGTVDAVDPAPGTEVEVGSTVKFTLQQARMLVNVPDVAGMSGTDALSAMQQVGLDLDYDADNPDRVLSGTNPSAGALVDLGTTVQAVYPEPEPEPAGAWTFNGEASDLKGDARDAFDEATGNSGLEPVAVLATRDVGARDYAILCKTDSDWHVVVVAAQDESGYQLASDKAIDITNVATTQDQPSIDPWGVPGDSSGAKLKPKKAKDAFDAAAAGYTGVSITPLATLASQVVNGTNYLVLGVGAPATENPVNEVYVVTLNASPDGASSFENVEMVDLGQYLQ